jgi:phage gp36-like protein
MSAFLVYPADYRGLVRDEVLMAVIRQDETAIELMEERAIEEMKGYLATRYDAAAIFNATGSARNQLIVMFCADITLYHLYTELNRQRVPQERLERYNRAIEWLRDVADGKISPTGLPTIYDTETGETDLLNPIRWGSNDKYANEW